MIIYNIFGEQIKIGEIRTNFKTYQVAKNFISEYQKTIPNYDFLISVNDSEIKTRASFRIFKKNQR